MNLCVFMGEVTQKPVLQKKEDVHYTTVTISVESFRKSNSNKKKLETVIIECEAWDTAAEYITQNFEIGDLILVHCKYKPGNKFRITEFFDY